MPSKTPIKKPQPKCSIGAHVSAAGDVALAPSRARELGCECFQIFSRPPQGGKAKPISAEVIEGFQAAMKECGQSAAYVHAPYFINLASANNRIYHGSISVLREELERSSQLGVTAMMTHLGSAKELGDKEALDKVVDGIAKVLDGYQGQTQFLIEIAAGAGSIMGDSFEEIAAIVKSPELKKYDIGVCFDTAHAFASGYDLRDAAAVKKTFAKFDRLVGAKRLRLIHANDCKTEFNSRKDRHEHIGQGHIGLDGFREIVRVACSRGVDMILETPADKERENDIKTLKKLRDKK